MRRIQMNAMMTRAGAAGAIGALLISAGCGATQGGAAFRAQEASAAPAAAPVVVSCGMNQRALVRPAVVNGAAVSQVECVSDAPPAVDAQTLVSAAPVYRASAPRAVVTQASDVVYADARVIPAVSQPVSAARPIRAEQIVYDERPVRRAAPVRSVKKSAVIIGSSAGAGAGIGAAVGGKKGALLGAVLGGGGATLWDQMTRRRN
jgi:hypothetical protein